MVKCYKLNEKIGGYMALPVDEVCVVSYRQIMGVAVTTCLLFTHFEKPSCFLCCAVHATEDEQKITGI